MNLHKMALTFGSDGGWQFDEEGEGVIFQRKMLTYLFGNDL